MNQVIVAKQKQVSLEELNAKLRDRLNNLIDDAGPEDILQITEAIAKLNSSYKNNSQFEEPMTDEEKIEQEQKELLGDILNGEEIKWVHGIQRYG